MTLAQTVNVYHQITFSCSDEKCLSTLQSVPKMFVCKYRIYERVKTHLIKSEEILLDSGFGPVAKYPLYWRCVSWCTADSSCSYWHSLVMYTTYITTVVFDSLVSAEAHLMTDLSHSSRMQYNLLQSAHVTSHISQKQSSSRDCYGSILEFDVIGWHKVSLYWSKSSTLFNMLSFNLESVKNLFCIIFCS